MIKICEYRFDKTIDANLFPNFNTSFINYLVTDLDEGDNIIKRTIEHDNLYPTSMSFNGKKGLIEFLYGDTREITNFSSMFNGCDNAVKIDVSNFDTQKVTTFYAMFYNCKKITELNLLSFDTRKVTSFYAMFYSCYELLELDLSSFDTSLARDLSHMFGYCKKLRRVDISSFDTSQATAINHMFDYCSELISIDVSHFKTSKATNLNYMFSNCYLLESLDVSNWDTSNVITMSGTFNACRALTELNLSNFNTEKVTHMNSMFSNCQKLTSLDLSNFNTSNVTAMNSLFYGCYEIETINLSSFDTRKVTTMSEMFRYCRMLNSLDISNFDTSNVNSMHYMFDQCYVLESLNLSNFNTQNVTRMDGMFSNCRLLSELNVSHFNTQNVTRMDAMFYNCQAISSLNLENFDTRQVTHMNAMFESCLNLTELNLSNFNTQNVITMSTMFYNCQRLSRLNISSFKTDNVTNMSSMFYNCYVLEELDVRHFNTENVTLIYQMFRDCRTLTSLDLSSFNTKNVTNMERMFFNCYALETLEVNHFDTSKVTNMSYMFESCKSLTTLDVSNFNTQNVTTMTSMFYNCQLLTTLDVSNFDTRNVKSMNSMFNSCYALTYLDVSNFDTKNVTTVSQMFHNCRVLTNLDVSNFDLSNATAANHMFCACHQLTSLDVSNFNLVKATNLYNMFDACYQLTSLNLSNFRTDSATNMSCMFYRCNSLEFIDVSSFNTQNVTTMNHMFRDCYELKSLDLSNFDTRNLKEMYWMFQNCKSLTSLNVSSFNTSNVTDMSYAFNSLQSLKRLDLSNFDTRKVVTVNYMFNGSSGLTWLDLSNFYLTTSVSQVGMFGCSNLKYIGMLYCDLNTINLLTQTLTNSLEKEVYLIDVKPDQPSYRQKMTFKNYKSNVLKTPKELTLNEMGSLCDSLTCLTGEVSRRVGQITLNGEESWSTYSESDTNISFISSVIENTIDKQYDNTNLRCDKLICRGYGAWTIPNSITINTKRISVCIKKESLEKIDVDGFKQFLSKNPITLQYELETPVIESVDLETEYQENSKKYIVYTHENATYVNASSEGLSPIAEVGYITQDDEVETITLQGEMALLPSAKEDTPIESAILSGSTTDNILNFDRRLVIDNTAKDFSFLFPPKLDKKYVLEIELTDVTPVNGDYDYIAVRGVREDGSYYEITRLAQSFANGTYEIPITFNENYSKLRVGIALKATVVNMKLKGELISVKMPALTTTGKNSLDISTLKNIRTDYDYTVSNYKCKKIKVEPNTTYTISAKASENVGALYFNNISSITSGANYLDFRKNTAISKTYTTNDDGYLYVGTSLTDDAIIESILDRDIQIEQGKIATSYEQYKTNILSCNEEVALRGIGDVQDTLDLMTGEMTERISEIVLDGSDNGITYKTYSTNNEGYSVFQCTIPSSIYGKRKYDGKWMSTFPMGSSSASDWNDREYVGGNWYGATSMSNVYVIKLLTSSMSSNDVNGFKEYLQQNPITIQYELVTPTVKTVDVTVYSSEKRIHFTYKSNEYGQANSSTVAPVFKYKMKSNNSFVIDELKKQKTYTLYYEGNPSLVTCGGEVNILLGSPQVITSGSNDQMLYFDNFVKKIQLIEGDTTSHQVPYFLGTLDSINPKIMIDNQEFNIPFTLRSSGDVKDQFNLLTGEFIQRLSNEHEILQEPIGQSISVPSFSITSRSSVSLSSSELSLLPFFSYICRSPNHYPIDIDSNQIYTIKCKKTKNGTFSVGGVSASVTGNQIISTKSTDHRLLFNGDLGVSELVVLKGDARNILTPYFLGLKNVVNPTLCLTNGASERNALKITLTLRKLSDAIKDEFDVISQTFIKRVGERTYRRGDETASEVLTDGKVTLYKLPREEQTQHQFKWSNGQMMSFDEQTNVFTECVHLYPHIYIKIPISTLEETIRRLKLENETLQEENISTMIAITEVFEMMMYIMPSEATTINIGAPIKAQQTNERGGFQMVEVYVTLIIKGKKTLEQVPAIIRPQVEAQLIELGVIEA